LFSRSLELYVAAWARIILPDMRFGRLMVSNLQASIQRTYQKNPWTIEPGSAGHWLRNQLVENQMERHFVASHPFLALVRFSSLAAFLRSGPDNIWFFTDASDQSP
jgi:hypothetical protein